MPADTNGPAPPAATDAQAKQTIHAAQVALHSIYGRDKSTANRLYNDLETWARSGHKPLFGSPPDPAPAMRDISNILVALSPRGGQDAVDAQAIQQVLKLPAAQVIKLGGFAPASVNPGTVSQSFTQSAAATAKAAAGSLNPLGALFQSQIWLRVAEVALGVILLAVGIAKLTNAVPIATKIAKVM